MTAVGYYTVLYVEHALFGDSDDCTRTLETGEDALYYRAALVEHHLGLDLVLFEIIYDVARAGTVYLLAA